MNASGRNRPRGVLAALAAALLIAAVLALTVGSTLIGPGELGAALLTGGGRTGQVVWQVRLPEAATAVIAGAGLATAGAVLQTLFANPLAEPAVLGVSAGASLGVAVVVSAGGGAGAGGLVAGVVGLGALGLVAVAAAGAAAVLGLVLLTARVVESTATLLLIGVMVSSAVTALVGLLLLRTDPQRAQQYLAWGLGSVSATGWRDLAVLAPVVAVAVAAALLLARPLDALLPGVDHARTVGVPVRQVRLACLAATSLIAGAVTAYCGPVAFLGMAVPHVARLALGSPTHRHLLPASALLGAAAACSCAVLAHLPGTGGLLPFNVVTALVGAPVVAAVLLQLSRTGTP